jgi:hypothetical protein
MVTEIGKRLRGSRVSRHSRTSQTPTHIEIRQAMEKLYSNKRFANAPMKQRFLQLICKAYLDGRADELNEYMIGCEVFGRDNSYNPALDPIVRVGAHELRKKLEDYYNSEGLHDEILLEIPIGSYIPVFTRRNGASEPTEPPEADTPPTNFFANGEKIRVSLARVGAAFLIVIVVILAYFNWELRRQMKKESSSQAVTDVYQRIWGRILKDPSPALLVLSNPLVYRFDNPTAIPTGPHIDLSRVEAKSMEELITRESMVIRNWSPPRLMLSYDEHTSIGDSIGLFRVAGMFNKMGKQSLLKQSRTVSAEDFKYHDAILLGSGWVNEWLDSVPIRKCFTSGASATIINRNLPDDQKGGYVARYDENGRLIEDFAVITVKPGISERKTVIVLSGMHSAGTQAAAEYITDEQYLADLNRRLLELNATFPKYFQVLLKVSVDNGTPTNTSVVEVRELN